MDFEITKLLISSSVQVFLGAGAWFFGWKIGRAQIHNQRSELRIKLYDRRYVVYLAFKDYVQHCSLQDRYADSALSKFMNETEQYEFLFGPEIRKYHREVIANSLAIRGLIEGLPCEDIPVAGGILGYFKGSTVLTDVPSLREWFVQQYRGDLYRYFAPYLEYSSAGVDLGKIIMRPPDLPEPPLVRRRVRNPE